VHVVHHGGLAATVGTGDGDQLGTVGQPFQVQGQRIAPKAVADAPEAFQRQ
jgi:hypothetical protein